MRRWLVFISLLACWPALASCIHVKLAGSGESAAPEFKPEWLTRPLASFAVQPNAKGDSAAWRIMFEWEPQSAAAMAIEGAESVFPQTAFQTDYVFQEPPISDAPASPSILAFFLIILVGGIIRFLSSPTFLDFLRELYSPLAPY